MRFAHLADCHIGSWRDPKLKDTAVKAFEKAVDLCIDKNIDFILISGDLFNTSLPTVDNLKQTVEKLKQLKDKDIPVYTIAGSHDFSPSGKTMLDVLEKAGLLVNVVKGDVTENKLKLMFTIDKKTNAKITGLLGKKGSLEKEYYENLIRENLENEEGYKIFMFHSALTEFKPKEMEKIDSHPLSLLPKNFNYYAGGHVHYVFQKQEPNYGLITYPGPLFPNNFKELEDLERGGLYIVEVEETNQKEPAQEASQDTLSHGGGGGGTYETEANSDGNISSKGGLIPNQRYTTKIEHFPVQIHNIFQIKINADNKTPEQIEGEIDEKIKGNEFNNTIITLRIEGTLASGKPSDINFKDIFQSLYNKSAYFVMKNTSKLATSEFEEIKVEQTSVEEIESKLIKEHLGQIKVAGLDLEKEEQLTKSLINILSTEKQEGEKVAAFETRIKQDIDDILNL